MVICFEDIIRKADGTYKVDDGNVRESFTDWEQMYEEKIEKSKENYIHIPTKKQLLSHMDSSCFLLFSAFK